MLERWPTFGLTAEQERRFRQAGLADDVARARLALALVIPPTAGFALNDYAFFGATWPFVGLVALRLAFVAWTLAQVAALKRLATPRAYDRALLAWGLGLAGLLVAINATRPEAFVSHVIVAMAVVFLLCLGLPVRFPNQVILCLAATLGEAAVLAHSLRASPRSLLSALLSLLVMSCLAVLSGAQLQAHRRREFLAREALRRANEGLERQVADRTRELRRAVEELDGFFTLSPDLLCIADLAGRFQRVSRTWEEFLGCPEARFVEHLRLLDMVHPDDAAASRAALDSARGSAGAVAFSNRCRRADGSYRWLEWHVAYVRNAVYAVARDVTEGKRIEEQVRQSQKLEAVGRLAGGVAHTFNNQLTAILGSSEHILEELPGHEPLYQEATDIRDAAHRAAALTRQLLAFGRRQEVRPRVLDLGALADGMSRRLRGLAGEDVVLELRAPPSPACVRADPGQLEQVIVNLVVNARDAMPAGGRLTLETAQVELSGPEASPQPGLAAGRYVRLTVTDTGTGMTPEVQSHLFEPFFTTKEVGEGTGLGLPSVYGIVKQAGGDVRVHSEPGEGSTFEVYLPLVEGAPEARGAPGHGRAAGGTETVLLVDDEPLVRTLAVRLLRGLGYRVLEAGDGEEALGVAREHRGDIELLVTDVLMPRMGGVELARLMRLERPGIEVLFMSGCTERGAGAGEGLDPASAFLQKPFTPGVLAERVRSLLDAASSAPSRADPARGAGV